MKRESGDGKDHVKDDRPERSLLIVVPRTRLDLYEPLKRSFNDDEHVEVIVDRRSAGRRGQVGAREPERRGGDRRRRSNLDADLRAGRWVTVRVPAPELDFENPDTWAILFLCCGEHVVSCPGCRMTYRVRWIPRTDPDGYTCPRCAADMTPAVIAHTHTCWYWATRGLSVKMPAKISYLYPPAPAPLE